jgi:hypothetical protein
MENETKQSTERSKAVARLYAFTLENMLIAARRDDKKAQARFSDVITALEAAYPREVNEVRKIGASLWVAAGG